MLEYNEFPEGLGTPDEVWAKLTQPSGDDNFEKLQDVVQRLRAIWSDEK